MRLKQTQTNCSEAVYIENRKKCVVRYPSIGPERNGITPAWLKLETTTYILCVGNTFLYVF